MAQPHPVSAIDWRHDLFFFPSSIHENNTIFGGNPQETSCLSEEWEFCGSLIWGGGGAGEFFGGLWNKFLRFEMPKCSVKR